MITLRLLFAMLPLLLTGIGRAEEVYSAGRSGKAELRFIDTIPVAIFEGTPQELGEQHSALLGKTSKELLKFQKRLFANFDAEFFYPFAVSAGKTLLLNAPLDYQREIAAATAGAGLEGDAVAVTNTLLELRRVGCSSLIVESERSATGELLFGRNFDFPPFGILDRYGLVKVIRPTGKHAYAEVGFPGLMGVVSGMNSAGLCVATLDVYDTADGSLHFDPKGVPMMLTFRQILEECATVAEAEALLKRTPATTQANLAVADRKLGVVFEITPKQVARRVAERGLVPCTNHFRTQGLTTGETCWRYDRLQQAQQESKLGVTEIQRHLHDANQGEFTLHTMIFEPRELVIHLALGHPPSSGQNLHRLELRELLEEVR